MKRKIIITLIGIMAIAAITTLTYAQPNRKKEMMHNQMKHGQMQGKIFEALGLSTEQKDKMQTMRSTHQKDMAQLRANAQIAQIELRDLLRQDNPKDSDVKAKIAAANAARGKVSESQIMFGLKMKQILTPEQRQKMQELRASTPMRGRGEGRMQGKNGNNFRQHRRGGPHGSWVPGGFDGNNEDTSSATKS